MAAGVMVEDGSIGEVGGDERNGGGGLIDFRNTGRMPKYMDERREKTKPKSSNSFLKSKSAISFLKIPNKTRHLFSPVKKGENAKMVRGE